MCIITFLDLSGIKVTGAQFLKVFIMLINGPAFMSASTLSFLQPYFAVYILLMHRTTLLYIILCIIF